MLTKKVLRSGGGLGLRQHGDVHMVLLKPEEVMH